MPKEKLCVKCDLHGQTVPFIGHSGLCPYKQCKCEECQDHDKYLAILKVERKIRKKRGVDENIKVEVKTENPVQQILNKTLGGDMKGKPKWCSSGGSLTVDEETSSDSDIEVAIDSEKVQKDHLKANLKRKRKFVTGNFFRRKIKDEEGHVASVKQEFCSSEDELPDIEGYPIHKQKFHGDLELSALPEVALSITSTSPVCKNHPKLTNLSGQLSVSTLCQTSSSVIEISSSSDTETVDTVIEILDSDDEQISDKETLKGEYYESCAMDTDIKALAEVSLANVDSPKNRNKLVKNVKGIANIMNITSSDGGERTESKGETVQSTSDGCEIVAHIIEEIVILAVV